MTNQSKSDPDSGLSENLVSLSRPSPVKANRIEPEQVTFNRRELNEILRIYGFHVAAGEWRDYAIDHLKDRAIFSIYRKTSEMALYRVEKQPKLAKKQGAFSVISVSGMILRRGSDLRQVLKVLEKKPKLRVL